MKPSEIWIHCAATPWGDALIFDSWHKARGWKGIGYHFVVLNGRPSSGVGRWDFLDGVIQPGRPLDDDPIFEPHEVGAHVSGRNSRAIGSCLVGDQEFTDRQLIVVKDLILDLGVHFGIKVPGAVFGHYEDPATLKTCPNVPMDPFRSFLRGALNLQGLQEEIRIHNRRI